MAKKKVRLILVNIPTASLFMTSWFFQNNYNNDATWENIFIYTIVALNDQLTKQQKQLLEQSNYNIFKTIVKKWYICLPKEYSTYRFNLFSPKNIFKERTKRKKEITKIKNLLDKASINSNDIHEIWCTSNALIWHFKFICNNAKLIFFEHGLSDLRNTIGTNLNNQIIHKSAATKKTKYKFLAYPLLYIKNKTKEASNYLSNYLERKFLFFKKTDLTYDKHISIFGNEIKRINGKISIETIKTKYINKVITNTAKNDPSFQILNSLNKNVALILLEPIDTVLNPTKMDDIVYFKHLEAYLLLTLNSLLEKNNIKTIVFKSKFGGTRSKKGFQSFNKIKKKWNCIFLGDYSLNNYPAEFYLLTIKPTIIIGSYSSALFYSKKILPSIKTFSYDKWLIDYCKKNWNAIHHDYLWLRPFFESKSLKFLHKYLPNDLI